MFEIRYEENTLRNMTTVELNMIFNEKKNDRVSIFM